MKLKRIVYACILILFISVVGCEQKEQQAVQNDVNELMDTPYKNTVFTMGTVVTISIYDKGKEAVLDSVFNRIGTLADHLASNDQGSEVDQINENAGIQPVKVSKDVFNVIRSGKAHSERVNGVFDISIGPLTGLWHIGYDDERKPSQSEIDAVLPLIYYKQIKLNDEEQTVFLKKKGMKLDLGAIAKGYIADEVVSTLRKHQVTTAIVDLGGNIYVMGKKPSGRDWTVGVQNPFSSRGEITGTISVSDKSIVTSGIYERYLEVGGVKYHHLLDPKDGYPIDNNIAGISIISDKSIDGDALSTSLFAKGIKEGMDYIKEIEGAEAVFVSKDKKIYLSPGLESEYRLSDDQFEIVPSP